MQNIKSRTAYSRHVMRSFVGGFTAMSYAKFQRIVMFHI